MTDPRNQHFDDLAELSSLDVGTICRALGRLAVSAADAASAGDYGSCWAIIWISRTDRAGRTRLERHDATNGFGRGSLSGTVDLARTLQIRHVLSTGESIRAHLPDSDDLARVAAHKGPARTIPLRDKRGVLGALTVGGCAPTSDTPQVELTLQRLADRAGVALANAGRFHAEQRINHELQQLLAPRRLPSMTGVDLAARLHTSTPGVVIGGDWYDVAKLPGRRLAITIGDVVGHGLASAVEMTQIRTGIRNLAMEGLTPREVLTRADTFLRHTGTARFVTCLHGVYHAATGAVDLAIAGHLRPIHLPLGGQPTIVPADVGLPLGGAADLANHAATPTVGTYRFTLRRGDSLLLFTDGMVEGHGRSTDEGVAQLVEVLRTAMPDHHAAGKQRGHLRARRRLGPSAAALCDQVMAARRSKHHRNDDDMTVLVLRRRHAR